MVVKIEGLHPCPFCGHAPIMKKRKTVCVECSVCSALIIRMTEEAAFIAWNNRKPFSTEAEPPHGDPYHVCITLKKGVEIRGGKYIVVEHECGSKPRLRLAA